MDWPNSHWAKTWEVTGRRWKLSGDAPLWPHLKAKVVVAPWGTASENKWRGKTILAFYAFSVSHNYRRRRHCRQKTKTPTQCLSLKTEGAHYFFQFEAQDIGGREGNVKYFTSKDKTSRRSISRNSAQIISTKGGNLTGKDRWVRKGISLHRKRKGENRVREY